MGVDRAENKWGGWVASVNCVAGHKRGSVWLWAMLQFSSIFKEIMGRYGAVKRSGR